MLKVGQYSICLKNYGKNLRSYCRFKTIFLYLSVLLISHVNKSNKNFGGDTNIIKKMIQKISYNELN